MMEATSCRKGGHVWTHRLDTGLEIKEFDDECGTFTGYGSTFGNEDLGGDIIVKGAFVESLGQRKPKFLLQHDPRQVLGVLINVVEDNNGLLVSGRFNLEKQIARDAMSDVKMGAIDGLSIGFSTVKADRDAKTGVRSIKQADLYEVSLVTFPMNEQARMTAVKTIAAQISTIREFEQFLRDVGFSASAAKAIASGGFKSSELRDGAQTDALTRELQKIALNILGD